MDKMKRKARLLAGMLKNALPPDLLSAWLLPAAAAMLLAYGAPLKTALSFSGAAELVPVSALAFSAAVWCVRPAGAYASLLGMAAGCMAAGGYFGCFTSLLMLCAVGMLSLLRREKGVAPLAKYAAMYASPLILAPVCGAIGVIHLPLAAISEFFGVCAFAFVLSLAFTQGLKLLHAMGTSRSLRSTDARLLALSLLAGLISAAFGYARPFEIALGTVFAAFACMCAAQNSALSAIACAAVIASCRVFCLNGDFIFIAVLCLCTLGAVLLRPLGRWGVLAGFCVPSIALFCFIRGTGTLSPAEALLSGAVFMLANVQLSLEASARSERELLLERQLLYKNCRLMMLSEVLSELSSLFDERERGANGFINRQLSGVANSLARLSRAEDEQDMSFNIGIGAAESPARGCPETGDSTCIRELETMSLAAISDGMGTGSAARRESAQTVQLLADLVSCGFEMDEAADCVNRLLLIRERGETYATLDAMLFDRAAGSVLIAKHGAPASYLLRRGKLNALGSEALPVGIVEEAKAALFKVRIKRGDVVIMMSDGVSDALGGELPELIRETARSGDPSAAANELVEQAKRRGGADDMTAIVAMVG